MVSQLHKKIEERAAEEEKLKQEGIKERQRLELAAKQALDTEKQKERDRR